MSFEDSDSAKEVYESNTGASLREYRRLRLKGFRRPNKEREGPRLDPPFLTRHAGGMGQALQDVVGRDNLELVEVLGDGNCQFHAVRHQLTSRFSDKYQGGRAE